MEYNGELSSSDMNVIMEYPTKQCKSCACCTTCKYVEGEISDKLKDLNIRLQQELSRILPNNFETFEMICTKHINFQLHMLDQCRNCNKK